MPEELRHADERVVGIISIGFILGFLIGLTGVGGGALLAPALYAVLGLGYQAAVSVTLIYAVITKAFSAVQHVRQERCSGGLHCSTEVWVFLAPF